MLRRLAAVTVGLALACTTLAFSAPATAATTHDPVITVYGFGGYSSQFDPIKSTLTTP